MDLSQTAVIHVRAKQLDRLFNNARLEIATGVAALLLALGIAWGTVIPRVILTAAAIGFVTYAIRFALSQGYRSAAPPETAVARWHAVFLIGVSISGLFWGVLVATLLKGGAGDAATAVILLVIILMMSSVVLHAGSASSTACFAITAALPMCAMLAAQGDKAAIIRALMLLVGVGVAIAGALIVKRYVWESIFLQNENEQLAGHLDQRRTQVEKLNVALKTNLDKREQAEHNLRRTAADLGLVQGKARALSDTLERVSPACQVTGLANRRHFEEHMDAEWRRAMRERKPISLAVIDLDEYEEYVETHGRQSADTLLKRVAQAVKGFGRRAGDLAGRHDESKLALLLPGCDARNSTRMAEALRKRIESHKIPHAGAKNRDVLTVHIGVATIKPTRNLEYQELFKRVDAALYEARFQGGNKVVPYKPLSKLKLERWDASNDGPLNEQSLIQKLLVWGYDTEKALMRPGAEAYEHVSSDDTVIALLTGHLKIEVEGHSMSVAAGDSIFVPSGLALILEVAGNKPVIRFTATKNK